jgi:RNA polymerase sigma-70 factor (ECF subfamily)
VRSPDRELEWTALMTTAIDGDAGAYARLLAILAPVVRATALQACRRYATSTADVEDVVQETLLAIHLKRHTWRQGEPIGPWVNAIARYKLIDTLRRRTRRQEIDIDGLTNELPVENQAEPCTNGDVDKLLAKLPLREQMILRLVSLEGYSMREAGDKLEMKEGAVRVALHRALKRLAELLRMEVT